MGQASEKGKEAHKIYQASEKGKEAKKMYAAPEKGKEVAKKYEKTVKRVCSKINARQKAFLNSLESDTGFNVICTSCREFKSKQACVNVNFPKHKGRRFTKMEETLYLYKDPCKTLSIDGHYYVCMSFLKQIKAGKRPKRNDLHLLEFCINRVFLSC